jgi:hypothetical protein
LWFRRWAFAFRFLGLRDAITLWFATCLAIPDSRFIRSMFRRMLGFHGRRSRGRHCTGLCGSLRRLGCRLSFITMEIFLEAAASAVAGKKSRFWEQLGMKQTGILFKAKIKYSMSLSCLESRPLVQLLS